MFFQQDIKTLSFHRSVCLPPSSCTSIGDGDNSAEVHFPLSEDLTRVLFCLFPEVNLNAEEGSERRRAFSSCKCTPPF